MGLTRRDFFKSMAAVVAVPSSEIVLPIRAPVAKPWALDVTIEQPGIYHARLHLVGPLPLAAAVLHGDDVIAWAYLQASRGGGDVGALDVAALAECSRPGTVLRCELTGSATVEQFFVRRICGTASEAGLRKAVGR